MMEERAKPNTSPAYDFHRATEDVFGEDAEHIAPGDVFPETESHIGPGAIIPDNESHIPPGDVCASAHISAQDVFPVFDSSILPGDVFPVDCDPESDGHIGPFDIFPLSGKSDISSLLFCFSEPLQRSHPLASVGPSPPVTSGPSQPPGSWLRDPTQRSPRMVKGGQTLNFCTYFNLVT